LLRVAGINKKRQEDSGSVSAYKLKIRIEYCLLSLLGVALLRRERPSLLSCTWLYNSVAYEHVQGRGQVSCYAEHVKQVTWDETRSEHSDFGLPEKICRHKFICNARGRDCTQRPAACHSANPRAGNFTLPCYCKRDTHASRGTGSYVDTSQRNKMSKG
jgi:hypothetical protein